MVYLFIIICVFLCFCSRNGQLLLPPLFFSSQELAERGDIIYYLCTSSFIMYTLFGVLYTFAMSLYIILVLDLCTLSTNKYNNNSRTMFYLLFISNNPLYVLLQP